jgi:hypothetical protein
MASGRKAFDKPASVQTLSAILTEDPPPIERSIPGPLRWTIDRCLAKDPVDRYDSSRDLYQELRNLRDHLSDASATQVGASAPRRRRWLIPAIAFLMGLGVALGAWWFIAPPPLPDQSAYRFTPLTAGGAGDPVWSPDSKLLYGIRRADDRTVFFSVDIATGAEKDLGNWDRTFSPVTNLGPGIRFSLAPDGKSFVYSIEKGRSNL